MRLFCLIRFPLLAVLVVACSSDGVFGTSGHLDYSAATFACGPADEATSAIYLAENPITSLEPAVPYVHIYLPVTIEQAASTRFWPISATTGVGAVAVASPGSIDAVTSGYLLIDSLSTDKTVHGAVDMEFPKAGHLRTAFHAPWMQPNFVCF
jgi:hypothetical protein